MVKVFRPIEAMDAHFLPHLRLGHLVQRLDWDAVILGAIFDEITRPPGLSASQMDAIISCGNSNSW